MLSEECARVILESQEDPSKDVMMEHLREKFSTARWKKIIDILDQIKF